MKPVVVVGSYNVGLTIETGRLPAPGETVLGRGYSEGPGGKGSNQAIAAARLGARVRFVGSVGRDRYGEEALRLWEAEGVEPGAVKRTDAHTGLAFIVVGPGGSNIIVVDPGANGALTPGDLASGAFKGCGVLLTQLEIPAETAAAASMLARREGAVVIMNPAPAVESSRLDLSSVDILTPNETEFEALAGTTDLDAGARRLLAMGPRAVVVTLGEKGARVVTKDDSVAVPAPRVEAVDSTGAGDAFNGALAVALSEGEGLTTAVRFANYAGALAVTKREVVPALPRRGELDEFRRNDVLE
ncbi:MAG: ribokinase [Nitrososphaerota archaeon]|nr:ribokinase [Nitrososphaerota archaeon]